MEASLCKHTRVRICFGFVAALLVLCGALLRQPFLGADGTSGAATYSHGILHLTIPYHADRRGTGQLTVEVLDPEDHVLGETEKSLEVAEGSFLWKEQVRLDKPLPLDELVWNRVRYRFQYQDTRFADLQGTESISQLLRMPVLHILAQQSYLEGSRAAVRAVVTDSRNEAIPGRSSLRIDLQAPGQKRLTLFTGQLNRHDTAAAQFQLPAGVTGTGALHYVVDTSLGSTEYTQTIRLQDKVGILLTTEKPIYQPGQMIHARALALDRADHEAVANRALVFEVEDSRGNKVFKKTTRTDEFGIASAEFELASEVNLGTYHLRALLGEAEGDSANSGEIALHVEKYVLPSTPERALRYGLSPNMCNSQCCRAIETKTSIKPSPL
jgi:MG2 domain